MTDFLSRIPSNESDPNEVLPISFVDLNLCEEQVPESIGVTTRSRAKQEGLTIPNIHGGQ